MKRMIIVLTAFLALAAFAGCESKDAEITETTTSVSEVRDAVDITTSVSLTEAEVTTEAETEAVTEETEATTEAEDNIKSFKGAGYTISIDSNKWLDQTAYLDSIAKYAENTDLANKINVTAEDMMNMGDAIYFHTSNGSNFNVVVADLGQEMDDATLLLVGKAVQEQYNSAEGYNCESYELVNVNGYRSLKVIVTADASVGVSDMRMAAYFFYPGTKQIGLTFTADASKFDEAFVDFEEVLNSISFE